MKHLPYSLSALLIAAQPVSQASSQGCLDDLTPTSRAKAFLSCLREMQAKIEDLESRPEPLGEARVREIAEEALPDGGYPTAEAVRDAFRESDEALEVITGPEGPPGPEGPQGDPGEPGSNAEFPEGAVVAFLQECDADLGWIPYYPAAGRVLVGAGRHAPENDPGKNMSAAVDETPSTALTVYDGPGELPDEQLRSPVSANANERHRVGGSETHTLTNPQMPAHTHKLGREGDRFVLMEMTRPSSQTAVLSALDGFNFYGPAETGEKGGNQPHNNMPPYIALYFCKKAG